MKQLSKALLHDLDSSRISILGEAYFQLPERVLQFGTGVLLRGLPDYFIDHANKQGVFNGRVVMIKSTDRGNDGPVYQQQDNLYTQCVRGFANGKQVDDVLVNASISRILSAKQQWNEILQCAASPGVDIIVSNTTEAGLKLDDNDNPFDAPPVSFPAKLLAVLHKRYETYAGDSSKGFVILPTELVTNNGNVLKGMVLQLAEKFIMPDAFIAWIEKSNYFCNTLVDRIVPGRMPEAQHNAMQEKLGYTDELMIMSECYSLWAIQSTSEEVARRLSFAQVNEGVVITPDISKYVELKLRLLNGTHTFVCGLAHQLGFVTVKEAMANEAFAGFVKDLMQQEIAPCIVRDNLTMEDAIKFSNAVLDRFRNPYLDHKWLSITLQYTEKMKMRNLPLLQRHFQNSQQIPQRMALGIAAYLLFVRCNPVEGKYTGVFKNSDYIVEDSHAAALSEAWQNADISTVVEKILGKESIWGVDLLLLPGFASAVRGFLHEMLDNGVEATFEKFLKNK